jgi:hypothetical protein
MKLARHSELDGGETLMGWMLRPFAGERNEGRHE